MRRLLVIIIIGSITAVGVVAFILTNTGFGAVPPVPVQTLPPQVTIDYETAVPTTTPVAIPTTLLTTKTTTPPTPYPTNTLPVSTPPFPLPPGPAPGNPYTVSVTGLAQRVHELINQQRSEQGLGTLTIDPILTGLAVNHSRDMAAHNFFSHVNLAGQDPTARGIAMGYTCRKDYGSYYTYGIAENIFQNNLYESVAYWDNGTYTYDWDSPETIAQTTVGGWMNSSGHRENILTPTFDREGIGVAIASDDKVYITEDFC